MDVNSTAISGIQRRFKSPNGKCIAHHITLLSQYTLYGVNQIALRKIWSHIAQESKSKVLVNWGSSLATEFRFFYHVACVQPQTWAGDNFHQKLIRIWPFLTHLSQLNLQNRPVELPLSHYYLVPPRLLWSAHLRAKTIIPHGMVFFCEWPTVFSK